MRESLGGVTRLPNAWHRRAVLQPLAKVLKHEHFLLEILNNEYTKNQGPVYVACSLTLVVTDGSETEMDGCGGFLLDFEQMVCLYEVCI